MNLRQTEDALDHAENLRRASEPDATGWMVALVVAALVGMVVMWRWV